MWTAELGTSDLVFAPTAHVAPTPPQKNVNRPYSLLLVPLGFALGFASNALHSPAPSLPPPSQAAAPTTSPENRRAHYRQLFLDLLEEPSSSLRIASFYALPKHLSAREMGYLYEAIYPEGWSRYHGDLPLALAIDWVEKDAQSFAASLNFLYAQHPDLADNFEGILFNLGLQNAMGAIPSIQAVNDPQLQSNLRSEFISGIRAQNPALLFTARQALLGNGPTFSSLTRQEYPDAVEYILQNPREVTDSATHIDTRFLLHLGKSIDPQRILAFDTIPNLSHLLNGYILAHPKIPTKIEKLLLEKWEPSWDMNHTLGEEEKALLVTRLLACEPLSEKLLSGPFLQTLSDGLTRETTDLLLAKANLDPSQKSFLLEAAVDHYSTDKYLSLLTTVEDYLRPKGIEALISTIQTPDTVSLLKELPPDWLTQHSISTAISRLAKADDLESILQLQDHFGSIAPYLPNDRHSTGKLWTLAPELYLEAIEELDPDHKKLHLTKIARAADANELSLILESGSFEQQTDVLIGLLHGSPQLATEILKHEAPENISARQAKIIGEQFGYSQNSELALDYYKHRPIQHQNEQRSVLTFLLTDRLRYGIENRETAKQIAELSPAHNYLTRIANAFTKDTEDIAQLESLKNENPNIFMRSLTHALEDPNLLYNLQGKANRLLRSPVLSNTERHQIHRALHNPPRT